VRSAATSTSPRLGVLEEDLGEPLNTTLESRDTGLRGRTIMVSADSLFAILLAVALYLLIHGIDASIHWGGHSWRH
jgi:hypothetical protein